MDEQKPADKPATEEAPFFIMIRAEESMVKAYLAPHPRLMESIAPEFKEPILVSSIARRMLDVTGGANGSLFAAWRSVVEQAVSVACLEVFGMVPLNFEARPASTDEEASFDSGTPAGHA